MDLLQALLSTLATLTTVALLTLQSLFGGFSTDTKVVILPPAIQSPSAVATSSSQRVIGTSTPSTSTKKAAAKPVAKTISSTVLNPAPPVETPNLDPALLNSQTRAALVNILCTTKGGGVHPISGSGVFIDTRGIILTNAHIGQYFLLNDYPTKGNVECSIRTGNPAQPQYRATLLYLPASWVTKNASQINVEIAKGTGEDDYAFLLVTSSTGPTPLPAQFPALPMSSGEPDIGASTLLAAYPAGFLDGMNIEKNLYISSAYANVREQFTFDDNQNIDLISIGGTVVSQGGSSGGAVVRASDGKLVGLISTATSAGTTAERDLRAITIGYINRSLAAHGEGGLTSLLLQNATQAAAKFASTIAPGERETLVKILNGR